MTFTVAGASKRGWTTWTTAAVDERVTGAIPTVLPILKLKDQLHRHWRAYGGWSFAFNDYWSLNLTTEMDNPGFERLQDLVDPFSYRQRFKDRNVAISVNLASQDEFFLPDEPAIWWDDVKNGPHTLH
eukprot:GABV01006680.1.p1 GENE.GABV01006680.1~~GABV01006680.1.p1  ORF type:complete len:128 (+),score=48.84 GABV01006680.1:27-410(+)